MSSWGVWKMHTHTRTKEFWNNLYIDTNEYLTSDTFNCSNCGHNLLLVHCGQIWMPVPGIFRPRSVPCAPTSNALIVAAMTRIRATQTSFRWTTACKASWGSGLTCPKTSKWTMTSGWNERSSPNPFHGRSCCSEKWLINFLDFFIEDQTLFECGVQVTQHQALIEQLWWMNLVTYSQLIEDGNWMSPTTSVVTNKLFNLMPWGVRIMLYRVYWIILILYLGSVRCHHSDASVQKQPFVDLYLYSH